MTNIESRDMKEIVLLWFEAASPGSAAGQHLRGTLQRLEKESLSVARIVAGREGGSGGWVSRIRRLTSTLVRALRVVGRNRLMIVRWHPAALIPLLCQRIVGGKSVLLVQGNSADLYAAYPFTARLPLDQLLIRPSLKLGTVHVAPTEGILAWITDELALPLRRSFVLPNGFDDESATAAPTIDGEALSAVGLSDGEFVVFVGKFAAWQGIDVILEAIREPSWPKDLPVVFIGDGNEVSQVRKAAETDDRIKYIGRVSPMMALAWTRAAAVSLAARRSGPASDRGVSPYKALEAAAMGTPIVATRVRGQAELVESLGNGIIVAPDSPAAIAEAVALLWADPDLRARLSRIGREKSASYTWRAGSQVLVDALKAAASSESF